MLGALAVGSDGTNAGVKENEYVKHSVEPNSAGCHWELIRKLCFVFKLLVLTIASKLVTF
jgi:hypothetical protein